MLRRVLVFAVFVTMLAMFVPSASAAPRLFSGCSSSEVRSEAAWILSAQVPSGPMSGAIAHYPDRVRLDPYLGNYAALGLVAASGCTRDSRYVQAAYRHLLWYASSQDSSGFVYDYELRDGVFVSTGEFDSSDGYAGTFLVAVQAWSRVDSSTTRLRALLPGVRGAVRAIRATQDVDGLTWATPSWRVKYLIDQVEALAGLDAAVRIGSRLGDSALVADASAAASRLRAGIVSLWDASSSSYVWAVHESGERVPYAPGRFYPDEVSQVWGISFGVEDPVRGRVLLDRMASNVPAWSSPAMVVPGSTEYWPVLAWGYSGTNRSSVAFSSARKIRSHALSVQRRWPYNPGVAGQLLVTLSGTSSRLWRS